MAPSCAFLPDAILISALLAIQGAGITDGDRTALVTEPRAGVANVVS